MELEFAKLEGLGNDFVFIEDMDAALELSDAQVKALCDRHFGIGADGVILVRPPKGAGVAYMHYINADGTLAQMCGNGVRCFAKYLVDHGLAQSGDGALTVDTMAGERRIAYQLDDSGKLALATVDMGAPILEPERIPLSPSSSDRCAQQKNGLNLIILDSPWGAFMFACVSMGNPHAVCFIENWEGQSDDLFPADAEKSLDTMRLDDIGAFFESHPAFPEKSNIEFACIEEDGISMRVFERGCGETLACGTGACATFVAASLTGRVQGETIIHLLGGDLTIDEDEPGHILMTGPAEQSFTGSVTL